MARPSRVELLSDEVARQGYLRVNRLRLRHELFAGGMGQILTREVIERGDAVAVLPYDPIRDAVVLIEQFRIGAFAHGDDDPWLIEIVAGIVEDGEAPEAVALREADEEAGLAVTALLPVAAYYASPGIVTERVQVYCGRVDAGEAAGVHGLAGEGEDIRVLVLGFDAAMRALAEGRVRVSPALVALQWLALNRDDLRRRWAGVGPASA
jgi:ADP-ribose pyrophosphatase